MFFVFPQAVPKKECKKLIKYCIKNTKFIDAVVMKKGDRDIDAGGRNDPSIRKTDIAFLDSGCKEDEQVNHLVWHFLQEANKKMFKYNLQYFQPIQFARYRNGAYYDWHQDSSGINPTGEGRKLSLTLSLSDPKTYEGGELQFFGGDRPMDDLKLSDGTIVPGEEIVKDIRAQGSVTVFDSRDFHRVTPCTKGTRYSIVCWTVGPNFI